MVHHATRGHTFSAQYDATVQDPIIAAFMRTELIDLLIPQDDNRGVKSLLYGRQRELISLPTLGPPRKSMIPTGAKSRVCPHGFRQIPHVDFDPDATEAPTLAIEQGMLLLQLQVIP